MCGNLGLYKTYVQAVIYMFICMNIYVYIYRIYMFIGNIL